jgi:hypothetical protein
MKSTNAQLEKRGFVAADQSVDLDTPVSEIVNMLWSKSAQMRTIAVRIVRIKSYTSLLPEVIELLKQEKALYTKIEIQKALTSFGTKSIPFLIDLLGCIGNNQHKTIVNADLNKPSFPLARDIAARILCQIGLSALHPLQVTLRQGSYKQKLEAVDAVGHISFNFKNYECENDLIRLYNSDECDELLKWKIIKAMQSFKGNKVKEILSEVVKSGDNEILINQAQRSLYRAGMI